MNLFPDKLKRDCGSIAKCYSSRRKHSTSITVLLNLSTSSNLIENMVTRKDYADLWSAIGMILTAILEQY